MLLALSWLLGIGFVEIGCTRSKTGGAIPKGNFLWRILEHSGVVIRWSPRTPSTAHLRRANGMRGFNSIERQP